MTDPDRLLPVPEDDALDAAVSAVIDGVATPEDEALIAAAPEGAARVEAQRAVARAVGAPVGDQEPGAAATGLAAALAALGEDATSVERPAAAITPMPPPRPPRGLPRLGVVAAVLLLVVGIGAIAVAALRSGTSNGAGTFAAAPQAKEDAGDVARSAAPATPGASSTAAPGPPSSGAQGQPPPPAPVGPAAAARDLSPQAAAPPPPPVVNGGEVGRQDDIESLALRVAAALDGTPDAATASDAALPSSIQACATAGAANANETVGALRYRATGTFEGAPAVFLAYDRPAGSPPRVLLVLARTGCSILASTHF